MSAIPVSGVADFVVEDHRLSARTTLARLAPAAVRRQMK
jgi:hypothetical protein